jgi:hypothetical protein
MTSPQTAKMTALAPIRSPSQLCDTCLVFNKTEDTCRGCTASSSAKAEHPATPPPQQIPTAPKTYAPSVRESIILRVVCAYSILSHISELLGISDEAYLYACAELNENYNSLNAFEEKNTEERQLVRETILTCEDARINLRLSCGQNQS